MLQNCKQKSKLTRLKMLQNCKQKSKLTRFENISKVVKKNQINKIRSIAKMRTKIKLTRLKILQEIRNDHIRKSSAKHQYNMTNIWIKNQARHFTKNAKKMYKSIEKLAHIIFINFRHVKYQEIVETYQEHIVIFLEFLREN